MAEIYVPIDSSSARYVIPNGEDILYSTMCKMIIDKGFGPAYTNLTTWTTHVLMTKSGFAMNVAHKKQATETKFIPWYEIKNLLYTGIFWGGKEFLRFIRNPNFETKKNFKKRRRKFPLKFLPYVIKSRENRIAEMEANPTKFRPKDIRTMKSRINSLNNQLAKLQRKAVSKILKMEKKN